jgi:hypothetical protein
MDVLLEFLSGFFVYGVIAGIAFLWRYRSKLDYWDIDDFILGMATVLFPWGAIWGWLLAFRKSSNSGNLGIYR